jgi:1,2-diacylglycerol 3-alpha-glucosyltransferase
MELITGQFNDSYKPVIDGVGNVITNYTYWLNKKYGKSYIVTLEYPDYVDDEEFEVLRYFSAQFPKRQPYRIGMPKLDMRFMKKINGIPFDILHAHCPFSAGQIALDIARKKDIPIVATFHSKYYDDIKQVVGSEQIAMMVLKRIMEFFRKVDFVWTVNKSTVNTLREYGFKGSVEVVANGTDFIPAVKTPQMSDMVGEKLHTDSDMPVLLYVGQHIWQKNLKTLLYSLSLLKKKGSKFKMVFVGTGDAEEALKKMTNELMLDDDVTFMGRIQDRELLYAVFSRACLFLLPSIYDNAPIVVKEAAAAGCPSLVIENSNASEDIQNDYNGFSVQNDPEVIAQRIYELLEHTELLRDAGANAQKTLCQNWENIIDTVAERYVDIIKTYKPKKTLYIFSKNKMML